MNPFWFIVIVILGVLFFGKNLPDVAKQLGSALQEFRKGVGEWKELHRSSTELGGSSGSGVSNTSGGKVSAQDDLEERFETFGTKFEPPSAD